MFHDVTRAFFTISCRFIDRINIERTRQLQTLMEKITKHHNNGCFFELNKNNSQKSLLLYTTLLLIDLQQHPDSIKSGIGLLILQGFQQCHQCHMTMASRKETSADVM